MTSTGLRLETAGGSLEMVRHEGGWHCHSLSCDGSRAHAVFELIAEALRVADGSPIYMTRGQGDPRMWKWFERLGFVEAYTVFVRR